MLSLVKTRGEGLTLTKQKILGLTQSHESGVHHLYTHTHTQDATPVQTCLVHTQYTRKYMHKLFIQEHKKAVYTQDVSGGRHRSKLVNM